MEDKRHGEGRFIWKDKREYEGAWANGKQSGIGYYMNVKGEKKKGLWKDGKRTEWYDE